MASPTRLLLVDDEPTVTLTLKAVLERENCVVQVCNTADEANALLGNGKANDKFHVALVDLRLGPASGVEVLKALHRQQPTCTPIVITGYGSLETAIAAMREGAFDYLLKPTSLDELKQRVKSARMRHDRDTACLECLDKQLKQKLGPTARGKLN